MTPDYADGNASVLRKLVRAFETGDPSEAVAVIDGAYVDHQGLGAGPLYGIEGFRRVVAAARAAWPTLRASIGELIALEDRTVARLHWDTESAAAGRSRRETIEIVRVVEHWGWPCAAPPDPQLRHPLQVVDYDPRWPERFRLEQQRLQAALGSLVLEVEHIGSTSVPELAAQPIIDIAIGIRSYPWPAAAVDAVVMLGYEHKGEYGIPRRHYFRKGALRTHHVHVLESHSPEYAAHILFKDYLRSHAETARQYERLKRDLARRVGNDHRAYQEGKSAFIRDVIRRARRGT